MVVSRLMSSDSMEGTVERVQDVSVDSSDLLTVDGRRLLRLLLCLGLRFFFLLGLDGVLGDDGGARLTLMGDGFGGA